jgi:ketosteroid isomerase-like protein
MNDRRGLFIAAAGAALLLGSPSLAQSPAPTAPAHPAAKSGPSDHAQIVALEKRYLAAFNKADVAAVMANYAPGAGLFVFDVTPPRQHVGWEDYKKDWEALFKAFPRATTTMSDLDVTVVGPVAYGHNIESTDFTTANGAKRTIVVRVSDVYRKIGGRWKIVQEHVSVPVDLDSGKADLTSAP